MRLFFLVLVPVLGLAACGGPSVTTPDGGGGGMDGSTSCEPPYALCGSRCINTLTDAHNCGSCGMECAAGSFCSEGMCSVSCRGGLTECGSSCVDLAMDREHCGDCDTACAEGEACLGGACGCPEGATRCGGVCVDPDTDPNNCGVCGRTCDADQMCNLGMCTCRTGSRETDCENGMDDDCDGMIDCGDPDCDGSTRPCMGSCGMGVETCMSGEWGMCEGGTGEMEICGDGIDQDCDGMDLTNPDMWEPNDDCARCALVSPDTDPDVTVMARFDSVDDNVDCFSFNADDSISGECILVTLSGIPDGHDYDIYLYRGLAACLSRDTLASSTLGGNADERIQWGERFALDDSDTYYVRVVRYRGYTCDEDYTLRINGLVSYCAG